MKLNRPYILYIFICLWLLFLPSCTNHLWGKDFVVVIDAGHGGHDPGAIGKISKEKNINLNVALKVGNLIKRNCDDVKVIYTRSKDVFIPLDRRAEIANNAKADLFISIHTNALANNRTAKGASTWTLGLAKSDANLEVAKRENSVILYESDYKTRYAGFNPNSAESYIIFEFMQDKYMEQSVHLASLMQKQFRQTCRRADRGVHQAGFLVLKASAMPSILIELGFISTTEEENPELKLRVYITGGGCSGFQYGFTFDEKINDGDTVIEKDNVIMVVDGMSLQYLVGGVVDYIDGLEGSRFTVTNPNATTTCGCGSSFSV
jgi:N-acetylmuramoyl-L-alanine amidase